VGDLDISTMKEIDPIIPERRPREKKIIPIVLLCIYSTNQSLKK
jgi:hypothetical protein